MHHVAVLTVKVSTCERQIGESGRLKADFEMATVPQVALGPIAAFLAAYMARKVWEKVLLAVLARLAACRAPQQPESFAPIP